MKRLGIAALFGALTFLAGYATSFISKVSAQTAASSSAWCPNANANVNTYTNGCQPLSPIVQGKGLYFSVEDQKKIYQAASKDKMLNILLAGTPEYRLNINQRQYYDPPRMTSRSKAMSHWDDAEMHEDHTQLYLVLSGSGTVIVGGKAVTDVEMTPGQHAGGPIEGGTAYKVKPGDWILIPPRVWHQVQTQPGGFTYGMVDIETRTNIP